MVPMKKEIPCGWARVVKGWDGVIGGFKSNVDNKKRKNIFTYQRKK